MPQVRFVGGHYDGADFVFADRLPEQVELTFDCVGLDMNKPDSRAALEANLMPDERNGLVAIRNAQSIQYTYKLESGSGASPTIAMQAGPSLARIISRVETRCSPKTENCR